ncbi:hypothetical protein [Variovorax sp. GT1P44]|uniref:hypothetical protein n=1 Tax=Variovorax sp. GT1P44 TaxID=3443742 RepID=UPI003F465E3F
MTDTSADLVGGRPVGSTPIDNARVRVDVQTGCDIDGDDVHANRLLDFDESITVHVFDELPCRAALTAHQPFDAGVVDAGPGSGGESHCSSQRYPGDYRHPLRTNVADEGERAGYVRHRAALSGRFCETSEHAGGGTAGLLLRLREAHVSRDS